MPAPTYAASRRIALEDVVEGASSAPRRGTARGPPRPASGAGAAASSRGWRPPRRCRAGRPGTGSRRAAACRGTSPRSTRRGRRRVTASRTADSNSSATSSSLRATFRPRPPPPKAALIAIGRPFSLRERDDLVGVRDRVLGAGDQRGADLLRDVAGLHLVAEVLDRRRRRADPDQAGVDAPPGRSRGSRRGSRSPGAPSRRRTSSRRRRSCRCRGRSRPGWRRRGCAPRRPAARTARPGRARRRPRRCRCRRPCRPGSPGPRSRHGWRPAPSAAA